MLELREIAGLLFVTATFGCTADVVAPGDVVGGSGGTAGSSDAQSSGGTGGAAAGAGGSAGGVVAGSGGASNAGAGGSGATGEAVGGAGTAGAGATAGSGAMSGAGTGGVSSAGATGMGATSGSGGASGAGGASGCGKPGMTGRFQASMTAFGLERGYYLSVPESYDTAVPQRLVFGYHGSNYTGIMMRQYLDLEKAPLLEGTIFVYPDGLPLEDQPDHVAWELDATGRDIAYFDELLAKLQSEYCIDPARIFVNGQSYGALMTNFVGCLRGDVVRAIAVVAGSGPRSSQMCQGQVAAWLTHGTEDDAVDFTSGEASRDHWATANHCDMTTTPLADPVECVSYNGCDEGHPVIWCPHTDDGGHQHPSFGRAAVREFFAGF